MAYCETDEEVIQACKDANIWTFVESLPDGLNTEVGGKVRSLSSLCCEHDLTLAYIGCTMFVTAGLDSLKSLLTRFDSIWRSKATYCHW